MEKIIYLLDENKKDRELTELYLKNEGFSLQGFSSAPLLLLAVSKEVPDMIIADLSSSGNYRLSLCTELRKLCQSPILLLSRKEDPMEEATALTIGADGYFLKPVLPLTLIARIKALFRRIDTERAAVLSACAETQAGSAQPALKPAARSPLSASAQSEDGAKLCDLLCYGDILLNTKSRFAICGEQALPLTPNEFDFLCYMFRRKAAVKKEELLRQVLNSGSDAFETRATDDLVKRLRKKLLKADSTVRIESVWGYGYRLALDTKLAMTEEEL